MSNLYDLLNQDELIKIIAEELKIDTSSIKDSNTTNLILTFKTLFKDRIIVGLDVKSHKDIYNFIEFAKRIKQSIPTDAGITFNTDEIFYNFYIKNSGYPLKDIEYTYFNYRYNNDLADWNHIRHTYNMNEFYNNVIKLDEIRGNINEIIKFTHFFDNVIYTNVLNNPTNNGKKKEPVDQHDIRDINDDELINPWASVDDKTAPKHTFNSYNFPYVDVFGNKITAADIYSCEKTSSPEFNYNDNDALYASISVINQRIESQAPGVVKLFNKIAEKYIESQNDPSDTKYSDFVYDYNGKKYLKTVIAGGFVSEIIKSNYHNIKSSDCDVFLTNSNENTYKNMLTMLSDINAQKTVYYAYFGSVVTAYINYEPRPYQFMSIFAKNLAEVLDRFDYSHIKWGLLVELCDNGTVKFVPRGHYSAHVAMESRITEMLATHNVKENRFLKPLLRGYSVYKSPMFKAATTKIQPDVLYTDLIKPEGAKKIRAMNYYYICTDDESVNITNIEQCNPNCSVTKYLKAVFEKLVINGNFTNDYELKMIDNIDINSISIKHNRFIMCSGRKLQVYSDYLTVRKFAKKATDEGVDSYDIKLELDNKMLDFLTRLYAKLVQEAQNVNIRVNPFIQEGPQYKYINVKFDYDKDYSICRDYLGNKIDPENAFAKDRKIKVTLSFTSRNDNNTYNIKINTSSIKFDKIDVDDDNLENNNKPNEDLIVFEPVNEKSDKLGEYVRDDVTKHLEYNDEEY